MLVWCVCCTRGRLWLIEGFQSRSARAVFQFYPENSEQMELVTAQAMKAGFYGGVVVDYPNSTKAKKFFLVLMTGGNVPLPKGLGSAEETQGQLVHCQLEMVNLSP